MSHRPSGELLDLAHLLLGLPVVRQELLLLTLTEEFLLLGVLAGSLGLGEVGVVDGLGDRDTGQVDLGRGGDDVGLSDSSEGDTVESERTRDKQETRVQLLQEDDSLSSESTGQEDEDGTGGDGRSELGLADGLSADLGLGDVLTLLRRVSRRLQSCIGACLRGRAWTSSSPRRASPASGQIRSSCP